MATNYTYDIPGGGRNLRVLKNVQKR